MPPPPRFEHVCAALPDVDGVEVLLVDDDYDSHRPGVPGRTLARLGPEPARALAALWRRLVEADQNRCHTPRYGLRFLAGDVTLLEAAVCFQCNNASLARGAERGWIRFDASAPPAVELLALLRACDPERAGANGD